MKIGITMRMSLDVETQEERDCLAGDWGRFMEAALPEVQWMPVPNC